MMIDPNKTYRTRDGRPVRIYATDGISPYPVHGALWYPEGWRQETWGRGGEYLGNGGCVSDKDFVEVTLADELRDQIPWEALRPEIRWVAMGGDKIWRGYYENGGRLFLTGVSDMWQSGHHCALTGVRMPDVDSEYWQETLIERPEDK